ncbi:hypothetical protein OH76DRAFT_1411359 [Lentinus brumalis]|uniref:Uncharacterized protein n=1 Tax=Lentinus brumalis TaxID=2498619 RepID=A0A371CPI6_9APHY|nr:hypothetical protein OH76DRAFT_1411359 [Polyporus brumalis]
MSRLAPPILSHPAGVMSTLPLICPALVADTSLQLAELSCGDIRCRFFTPAARVLAFTPSASKAAPKMPRSKGQTLRDT